jgi:hypothetical protein
VAFQGKRTDRAPGPIVKKLLLMSILFATIGIPTMTAKDAIPQRGLRKTLLYSAAFYVVYWFVLMFVIVHLE